MSEDVKNILLCAPQAVADNFLHNATTNNEFYSAGDYQISANFGAELQLFYMNRWSNRKDRVYVRIYHHGSDPGHPRKPDIHGILVGYDATKESECNEVQQTLQAWSVLDGIKNIPVIVAPIPPDTSVDASYHLLNLSSCGNWERLNIADIHDSSQMVS